MTRRYEARRARLAERVATAGLHVWLCIAVALSGALGLPAPARADDASEAALHFELGSRLYGSGDYAEALDHFLAANRLAPNPSYAFNIAQTYALLGRQRDAYNWYETHLTEYTLSEADRAESTARRDALAARLAIIDVTCDPPGAEVFLDRTELGNVGRAPRRLAVEPGSHVVFGRHVGHHESSVTVLAVLGAVVPAQLSLPSLEGTLTVVTEPPGATVRLEQGGASLGATPLEVTLPVGTHVLVIELAEHLTDRRAVTLEENAALRLEVELEANARTTSVLSVTSTPAGASVELRDISLGGTPLSLDGLSPGAARIRVSLEGHEPWSGEIVLEPGSATRVTASLRAWSASDPGELSWIGYAAGAVAMAGAIAAGISALVLGEAIAQAPYGNPLRSERDSARAAATAADVLGVVAAVLFGGSLAWDLGTSPPPASSGSSEIAR